MSGNQSGTRHETTLHQKGMKTRSAEAPKAKPKAGSVNNDATRSATTKTPKTIGPRCA